MAVDTGNGATLSAFSVAMAIETIAIGSSSRPAIDTSHLGTTGFMTYIPGDLADTPEVEVTVLFDPTDSTVGLDLAQGAASTATITFDLQDGSTAADVEGTAFVTDVGYPTLANNELMKATFTFKFDGETGPTFTAES